MTKSQLTHLASSPHNSGLYAGLSHTPALLQYNTVAINAYKYLFFYDQVEIMIRILNDYIQKF